METTIHGHDGEEFAETLEEKFQTLLDQMNAHCDNNGPINVDKHQLLSLESIAWAISSITSVIDMLSKYAINPYVDVVDRGNGSSVLCHLHRFIHILSFQSRKKIAKSMMLLLGNMDRWLVDRPDLLKLVLTCCCSTNDFQIEAYNSANSGGLPSNMVVTQTHMKTVSLRAPIEYYSRKLFYGIQEEQDEAEDQNDVGKYNAILLAK
jgi:hypothetical protein